MYKYISKYIIYIFLPRHDERSTIERQTKLIAAPFLVSFVGPMAGAKLLVTALALAALATLLFLATQQVIQQ